MGNWKFSADRVVDLIVPGTGMVVDAMDASEFVEVSMPAYATRNPTTCTFYLMA